MEREKWGHSRGQLLGYPELSERGNFMGGRNLIFYLIVLLGAVFSNMFIQGGCLDYQKA